MDDPDACPVGEFKADTVSLPLAGGAGAGGAPGACAVAMLEGAPAPPGAAGTTIVAWQAGQLI